MTTRDPWGVGVFRGEALEGANHKKNLAKNIKNRKKYPNFHIQ